MTDSRELHDHHDDFGGLHVDVPRIVGRRKALQLMGGIGLAGVAVACGATSDEPAASTVVTSGQDPSSTTRSTDTTIPTGDTNVTAGDEIPEETAGPYPADGSNGPNILDTEGIVRSDIRSSIGSLAGTAAGTEATIQLTIVDADSGSPLPGSAVYAWHCTADGAYSMYEITDQNYLRGVQAADATGKVTFTSVFPGCYNGRWPHVHFEVYDSLDSASSGSAALKTSQLALPQAECELVYADDAYGPSAQNLARQSLSSDNVFRDGWTAQLATVAMPDDGPVAISLLVRV
ncbi:MAG: hypothetical protein R2695_04595 [Acidimicrobiales bacterium]